MGAWHVPCPSSFGDNVSCLGGPGGKYVAFAMVPSLSPATGGAQKGKECPGRTMCLHFPRLGCWAGCWACCPGGPPPPPNLHLKLSFPSFVLPIGTSPSPPRAPSAALAVPRVVWRGPAGLRPAHPVPPIATAAWRSPPPPPPASPASPPTTPASSPRTPLTPNRRPPCPRTSPARYREGQRHQPPPHASVSPSVEWVGAAGCNTRVCLVQR